MRQLNIPKEIQERIASGATLAISISGGKDSQALLKAVVEYIRENNLSNPYYAIHADLGRAEWKQSKDHCKKLCDELGVELVTVARTQGDLVQRWEQRMEKLKGTGKPFWSSSASRYCTSDLKRNPINKEFRKHTNVISVEGIRAQESRKRATKPCWEPRTHIVTKERQALTWNAIIDWTIEDVWDTYDMAPALLEQARQDYKAIGEAPEWWPFHPVYAMGNERVSCAICVLASKNDIQNGVKHNPELAKHLSAMEKESGFTFRMDMSISELIT